MKRKYIIILLISSLAIPLSAQTIDIRKVKIDSLFKLFVNISTDKVYYSIDTTETLSHYFQSPKESVKENLTDYLKKQGYSFFDYNGVLFIMKGIAPSETLPDGYFLKGITEADNQEHVNLLTEETNVADIENKVYEIGDRLSPKRDGKAIIRGYIRNIRTGEPVVGAGVFDEKTKIYSETDQFGQYVIHLNPGEIKLNVQGYAMEDVQLNLVVYGDGSLDIQMKDRIETLKGTVIYAESNLTKKRTQMGVDIVRIDRIKHIPTVFGEADILKVIMSLPGVKSVGEASGGFNVRGGATDQNLILFNEGMVYNPTHLFGLFSAFNPDIVNDVELYKSSIPPHYGGRISSVLEVKAREGNSNKITGSAGIGLLTSRVHLEGPITKKTTFIVGGRTTYSNWILNLLPDDSEYKNGTASFRDVNIGVTHKFNENNSLSLTGYYSVDGFKFNMDTSFRYNNYNAAIKWRRAISEKRSFVISAGYDRYGYDQIDTGNEATANKLLFDIQQEFLKMNFKRILSEKHILSWGINTLQYNILPGSYQPYGSNSIVTGRSLAIEQANESAVFANDTWNINDDIMFDFGLRYSMFYKMYQDSKFYSSPEIRLSGRYLINNRLTLKAGFNSMTQYIHMLSNTTTISPTDIWKLSDSNIKPQKGWQAAAGLYTDALNNMLELSLETYYKSMNNYLDYKSGAVLVMNEDIAEDVVETQGRAYGIEFMVKKNAGKLNGWFSYNYSKTQLKEDSGRDIRDAINRGEWYNAPYDKPHDFKLIGNYKFTRRYSVSMNLDYSTGRPITIPVGKYWYGGGYKMYYSDRNQYRIPDYFRLDLAVNIEPSHKITQLTHFSITFGVYNVTARKNAYSVFYKPYEESVQGYMMTIFGTAIPYININVKF